VLNLVSQEVISRVQNAVKLSLPVIKWSLLEDV